MLKRDDELRLSARTQKAYGRCTDCGDEKIKITEAVQRQVAREFGFAANMQEGLEVMRCAASMFPDDEGVRDSCHYYRYNIHVPCPIAVGDRVPDLVITSCSGGSRRLHELCSAVEHPTLLLAGSIT